ncbi:MAG: DUF1361 domain-containing protein [Oscillospiraceae bacterium]
MSKNSKTAFPLSLPPLSIRIKRLIAVLAVLTLVLLGITLLFYDFLKIRYYLFWNMALAIIPLGFALLVYNRERLGKPKPLTVVWGLCWLAFFPNAPYLITDFIHLNRYDFGSGGNYNTAISPWLGLVQLSLGVLAGAICGLLSLYLLQMAVRARWGSPAGWLFAGLISILSGVGIYIGRFMRFNSWDLLVQPAKVAYHFSDALGLRMVGLSALFAFMIFASYLLFYVTFDCTCNRES